MQGFARTAKPSDLYTANTDDRLAVLQRRLLCFSLFNFLLVTVSGLLLRSMPVIGTLPLSYGNILHGHSHFAFGGWITPALLWMIMGSFPEITRRIPYVHWRNVFIVLMVSAYGMLLMFPLHGYGLVSIFFSTLSIAATYYFAIMILRITNGRNDISTRFLRAALFLLMSSALGPFAIGPLHAAGKAETAIYFNCVYFYLHFQYNGWFSFAILAVAYRKFSLGKENNFGRSAFVLLFTGCVLSLFLSFLWNQPGLLFNIAGGAGAVLQLVGLGYLLRDLFKAGNRALVKCLEGIALGAFALKLLLQLFNAFPVVAATAYLHRNLIIAYLHLIMLGFVSTFILGNVTRDLTPYISRQLKLPVYIFLVAFVASELLLVSEVLTPFFGLTVPAPATWMFIISSAFPISALLIFRRSALYISKAG
jgi:hypothetical protein